MDRASNAALTRAAAGFSLAVNAYRYTGKRLDAASNTLDMGARRFSRASGRFLQVDSYDGALANLGLSVSPLMGNRYALAAGNPITYVEVDGHVFVLEDIGGKPLTGYGSGANSDSPVATREQAAAVMQAEARGLGDSYDEACREDRGARFASAFCRSLLSEVAALRYQATLLTHKPSFRNAARQLRNPIEGSNTVLVILSGACVAGSVVFTGGTTGPVCASIYTGATATSVAATAYGVSDLKNRQSNSVETIGTFNAFVNAVCPLFGGSRTTACRIITGSVEGIIAPSLAAARLRDAYRPNWGRSVR